MFDVSEYVKFRTH